MPIAIGLIIFFDIVMFGKVTGGHFNPAVTLGVFIKDGSSNFEKNLVYSIKLILS